MVIHKSIRKALDIKQNTSDNQILFEWKKRIKNICKPCWELKYCPYGPIIEEFPLLPLTRKGAEEHNNYLINCLRTGVMDSGDKVDSIRKKFFRKEINNFDSNDYPEIIPRELLEASCRVFGHICPVFYTAEPLTETKELRKHTRQIQRDVMLKVVRRDGQICQKCNQPVFDDEVEFDHIIPFSKGGKSTVENLRLVHKDCNRHKSNSLSELLHPSPIEHLFELRRKNRF